MSEQAPHIKYEPVDLNTVDPNSDFAELVPGMHYLAVDEQARIEQLAREKATTDMLDPRRILELRDSIELAQRKSQDERFNPYGGDNPSAYTEIGDHRADIRGNLLDRYIAGRVAADFESFPDNQSGKRIPFTRAGEHGRREAMYTTQEKVQLKWLEEQREAVEAQLARPRAELEREVEAYEDAARGARSDNKNADKPVPFTQGETLREGTGGDGGKNDESDDGHDDAPGDHGPDDGGDQPGGSDGGAETNNDKPEHAEQRRRARWPLGIGAVGAFFGRRAQAVRNIFQDEPSDNYTSAMGGRLRIEESADGDEGQEAPAEEPASETQAPEHQEDELIQDDKHDTQHDEPEQQAEQSNDDPEDASQPGQATTEADQEPTEVQVPTRAPKTPVVNVSGKKPKLGERIRLGLSGIDTTDVFWTKTGRPFDQLSDAERQQLLKNTLSDSRRTDARGQYIPIGVPGYGQTAYAGRWYKINNMPETLTPAAEINSQDEAPQEPVNEPVHVAFGGGVPVPQRAAASSLRGYHMLRPVTGGLHLTADAVRDGVEQRSGGKSRIRR